LFSFLDIIPSIQITGGAPKINPATILLAIPDHGEERHGQTVEVHLD
jgi:hypothetical protein